MQIGRPYIDGPRSQVLRFDKLVYYNDKVNNLMPGDERSNFTYYNLAHTIVDGCDTPAFLSSLIIGDSTYTIVVTQNEWFWASGFMLISMMSNIVEHLDRSAGESCLTNGIPVKQITDEWKMQLTTGDRDSVFEQVLGLLN